MLHRSGRLVSGALLFLGITAGTSTADAQVTYRQPREVSAEPSIQHPPRAFVQLPKVTLRVKDSTIAYVVDALARQARLQLLANNNSPAFRKRVTVNIVDRDVLEAIASVLKGTGLTIHLTPDRQTIVIRDSAARTSTEGKTSETGIVSGIVTDSVTSKGIAGVTVTVQGTKLVAITNDQGRFTFRDVPTGEYTVSVKLFGYRLTSRPVTVVEGKPATPQIRMTSIPTALSGVVTTATGIQRRVEIGNDITTIKVDSIMKTMPVSSMTELLATRVPGLNVAPTSGAPGAPSRIRIRGVSSINSTNDPIVILDGIRMYARQIEEGGNLDFENTNSAGRQDLVSQLQTPSPLDQIDPNSIETVEVLKGPSAVALYGTDASNGVIVITTKRGQAGPTRWTAGGTWGQTRMPGKWPENYVLYGRRMGPSGEVGQASNLCVRRQLSGSIYVSPGLCVPDSLAKFQILNDPQTTVFGTGATQLYRSDVRGGTRGLTFSFSVSSSNEVGYLKMPDVDVLLLESQGTAVPGWQRRPQSNERQNGTARMDAELGQKATVSLMSTLGRTFTRSTPLQGAGRAARFLAPADINTIGSGLLSEINEFREQSTSRTLRASHALDVRAGYGRWITTTATAGVDVTNTNGLNRLASGECETRFGGKCLGISDSVRDGKWNTDHGSAMVTSLNLGAVIAPARVSRWLSMRTSFGGNVARTQTAQIARDATGLLVGATSGNDAQRQSTKEVGDDRIVAGVYVETMLDVMQRFYLPLAIRQDAGSGLGGSIQPRFPKLSFSWLVSEHDRFRTIPILGTFQTLRLRTAYGQSGVQPAITRKLRTYGEGLGYLNGIPTITLNRTGFGNTGLRPERTAEWEGGFDADLLGNRVSVEATFYRKRTLDMLIDIDVPPSVDGGGRQMVNIGTVRATGAAAVLRATLLQRQVLDWQVSLNVSKDRNTLTKLNDQPISINAGGGAVNTQFVVGYPLYGQWARPIRSYFDRNGDGIITGGGLETPVEIQLADDPVFLGAPYPKFEYSVHSTAIFFRDFSLGVVLNYQQGLTQVTENASSAAAAYDRGYTDPALSQLQQAYYAAGAGMCETGKDTCSAVGFAQTVSTLRWNALSMSYLLPRRLTRSVLSSRTVRLSIQGTNLGLWTNYRGKDPNVNAAMSEIVRDIGILPTARLWQFSVGIN